MPRRAARKDGNHDGVCQALEAAGWKVYQTFHVGDGFSDLMVARHGVVHFVEVKNGGLSPSRRQLTAPEKKFRSWVESAGLSYRVINSIEEAVELA